MRTIIAFGLACLLCLTGCEGDDDYGRAPDITVASLNILHGLPCPRDSASCRLADRIELLFQWIQAAGCPDVVTLQEVWRPIVEEVGRYLGTACPFSYEAVIREGNIGPDEELVLTRYPVTQLEAFPLYGGFRRVLFTRIAHPTGSVDVFSTHLASGSDGAHNPCGLTAPCPAECVAANAPRVRDCQAVQMAQLIETQHDIPGPAIIAGDLNDTVGTFVYEQFAGRGWIDSYLAAGNPECDPVSGVGCTTGRIDNALTDLEQPESREIERIDFIFVVPPTDQSDCDGRIDSGADGDVDGVATKIFADDPNPFASTCGPSPAAICWPSDHEGMQLDLNCG